MRFGLTALDVGLEMFELLHHCLVASEGVVADPSLLELFASDSADAVIELPLGVLFAELLQETNESLVLDDVLLEQWDDGIAHLGVDGLLVHELVAEWLHVVERVLDISLKQSSKMLVFLLHVHEQVVVARVVDVNEQLLLQVLVALGEGHLFLFFLVGLDQEPLARDWWHVRVFVFPLSLDV